MEELVPVLKAKLKTKLTSVDSGAEECLKIPGKLFGSLGLVRFQKVSVSNLTREKQFETFLFPIGDDMNSEITGEMSINGEAAKHCEAGDEIIMKAYSLMDFQAFDPDGFRKYQPGIVEIDGEGKIT